MSRRRPARVHGLLPVNKASGPTSHDVVDMARRALGERRVGHTGTLDPMATGLLLLCVGQATRLQQFLMQWPKCYCGTVRLGRATTTYDGEGETMAPTGEPPHLDPDRLAQLQDRFEGVIEQVPPPYSAKKVEGRKLYELAREGRRVELEARPVTVHRLRLEAPDVDLIELEVETSSGFYVRSLAHDLGVALGCGGHLERLVRSGIGPIGVDEAIDQQQLVAAATPEEITGGRYWLPVERIPLPFPALHVNRGAADRFGHGQEAMVFRPGGGDDLTAGSEVAVRTEEGDLLGIGIVQNVLARGRTIAVKPHMVLDIPRAASAGGS